MEAEQRLPLGRPRRKGASFRGFGLDGGSKGASEYLYTYEYGKTVNICMLKVEP